VIHATPRRGDKRRVRRGFAIRLPQCGVYFKSVDGFDRKESQREAFVRCEVGRKSCRRLRKIVLNAGSDLGGMARRYGKRNGN
jgi:hypothetical protein